MSSNPDWPESDGTNWQDLSGTGAADERAGLVPVVAVLIPLMAAIAGVVLLLCGWALQVAGMTSGHPLVCSGLVAFVVFVASFCGDIIGVLLAEPNTQLGPSENQAKSTPRTSGMATTALASFCAGRRRSHLRDEWHAHLAGPRADGEPLSEWQRRFYAAGFLAAALRMRTTDLLRPIWKPVDWVLRSDGRVNTVIIGCGGAVAVYLIGCDGLAAFLGVDCLGVGVIGTGAFTLLRWLRKVRGIELAQLAKPGSGPADPPTD